MNLRLILFIVPLLTCTRIAQGQINSSSPREMNRQESEADALFFEGKEKAREQKWDEALLLFERSWQLKPSYDCAGNLGQVALKLGLYTKAATYLDRCLHMFPATGSKTQRDQIESLFREASTHVATVHFSVAGSSGELVLDRSIELGTARGPLGAAVYVNPGTHILQLLHAKQVTAEQSFLAVANASFQVQIGAQQETERTASAPVAAASDPEPAGPSATASPVAAPFSASERGTRSLVPVYVGATISVASFIAAGALLSSAKSHMNDAYALQRQSGSALNTCSNGANAANAASCGQLHNALAQADRRYNGSYALFGLGGVSLAATVAYALWPVSGADAASNQSLVRHSRVELHASPGIATFTYDAQF
jgi:tetratricopeptide (TPR) repeat protein